MKKNILTISIFLFINILSAQNEFYINGDNTASATNPEVYINGKDGTNPTLFVAGEINNNQGEMLNVAGEIELTGNFTNTANGTSAKYQSTGIERFSGDANSTVYGTMDDTTLVNNFYDLKLKKDAASDYLNLSVNSNVRNTLEFESNGIIRTDVSSHGDDGGAYANELYILNCEGTGTTITGGATAANVGNNYVEGKLRHKIQGANTYLFPIGITPGVVDAGTQPVSLAFTAADTADILAFFQPADQALNNGGRVYYDVGKDPMANQVDNLDDCAGTADGILDQLILNVDQDYQWQVNKGIKGSSFNYAITVMPSNTADITATNGSTYGCNNIDLRYLAKNGDVGGDGVTISNAPPSFYDNGYVIAPTGYTISGQSSFSKFRLHSVTPANVTLPVELLSLVAYGVENKYINVDWATATEINNEGFDIERSTNGVDFYKVGYMQGNGNSSSTIDYRFEDYEVQKDIVYYYRLKQVDYNGEYEYSPIVNASLKGNNDGVYVSIYPNPSNVREEVIVEINSNMDTDAEIVVSDIIGKLILSDGVSLNKGINKYTINNGFLAVGQYFVTVKMPQQQLTKNVIVTE